MTPRTEKIATELMRELCERRTDYLAVYHENAQSKRAKDRLAEWDEQRPGDAGLEALRRILLPGLLIVENRYAGSSRQWTYVFRVMPSKLNVERYVEFRGPALPQIRPHGAPTVQDNALGERFVYNAEPHDIALETAFQGVDDDNATRMFAPAMLGMAESFLQAEEIVHAGVLNTGRVYNPAIVGDGCPLFGWHPIDEGKYSNRFGHFLTATALEEVHVHISRLQSQAGIRLQARPEKLVVPIEQEFLASRLIRAIHEESPQLYPEGYCVLDYLTDPQAWYVTTDLGGLDHFDKQPFKLDLKIEGTKLVLEGSQSYCAGYHNPRGIIGSFPE